MPTTTFCSNCILRWQSLGGVLSSVVAEAVAALGATYDYGARKRRRPMYVPHQPYQQCNIVTGAIQRPGSVYIHLLFTYLLAVEFGSEFESRFVRSGYFI